MLTRFEHAMRAAAEKVAAVDRDVRLKLVTVKGREERYSEKFVTLLDERMSNFSDGGVTWSVATHISDKQSGQETRTGADLFISLELSFDGLLVQKGIQVQSKINKNTRYGLSVDSKPRLRKQCERMVDNSPESFVFAFGAQGTKIVKASSVLASLPDNLSDLVTQSPIEFFYDFFVCRVGDHDLFASSDYDLQQKVKDLEYRAATLITGVNTGVD
ncbi:hypothetical protein EN925_16480 [Mesorhizobium sp. M7A.F.Ca.US.006.04.2.1]|uniref:hypothetical protein n=3 Tax=Mesorhizobium TaxID=68287 RepID=UPI000FCCC2E7|nr:MULTISPECIES: hypothetical protein [unclassified Mesorhizobium]RUX71163.1 hypothetical protein EN990_29370 [Mesorhizobium sp. M7A.F.Ca.US.005.03.1.1]RUY26228.1 hypothetical protein EN979_20515 [Mesorhizobium sp. M7A.F.Ca.US.001.04.2.1]RUY39950.1 hypothetical protein EN978_19875 [Mesorhizobium sp. M7A.F.Ca.US.001.04.1.1]RVA03861.1 hypothetical protein EN938_14720 [Mesorhizobium sp. M7A.F.Ca.US.001.02.1.1]RVA08426.1 hypothetical protein EN932_25875 [Mesorhizobium sp. M7A.F.Ca.US.002.01.1.1]